MLAASNDYLRLSIRNDAPMTEDERAEYLALRQQLIVYLEATQQQIIDYPVKENTKTTGF